jgi:hypothetical protein
MQKELIRISESGRHEFGVKRDLGELADILRYLVEAAADKGE